MARPIPVEEMVRQFKAHHSGSHIFMVEKFSLLRKHQIEECESSVFDIGGYKWKLILFPNGNEKDNGKGHISLYLEIQDLGSLPSNWEVKVELKLFVLNQHRQIWNADERHRVFNASNTKLGVARLISLVVFYDSRQGYCVDDFSLFGTKILGLRDSTYGTAECFSMIEKPPKNKFTWFMKKFSGFEKHVMCLSDEFVFGNRKWRIQIYPKGFAEARDNSFSVFLLGSRYTDNTPRTKTYAKFRLRVLDQIYGKHIEHTASYWFPVNPSTCGSRMFMPLRDLHDPSKGFLVNDMLYVGVEIDVISMTKYC